MRRSWSRATGLYGLDPGLRGDRHVLSSQRLRDHVDPLEAFLRVAHAGMAQLHAQLHAAGYVMLLADPAGVAVAFLSNAAFELEVGKAHLGVGTRYAEADEGTCGIGTCLAERAPMTIHKAEHYLRRNIGLTCTAAPIFAPGGNLLSVLCASSVSAPDEKRSQQLAMQMVSSTARLIEDAWFCHLHKAHWLLNIGAAPELLQVQSGGLIAVDEGGRVVALNRSMQEIVGSAGIDSALVRTPIAELLLLHSNDDVRRMPGATAVAARLVGGRIDVPLFCKVDQPQKPSHSSGRASARPGAGPQPADALGRLSLGDASLDRNIALARRLATRRVPIVLLGETGTGKELFASAIHEASGRSGRFVAINCGAIPEPLVESELFGYSDGAFTGARTKGRRGKIVDSCGGTLFLDEIGDMPLALQTRLLRVLAEGEVAPLGSDAATPVDLRVVCATHRDLERLVHSGLFRADLYYRLSGACIRLPPLRARADAGALIDNLWRLETEAEGRRHLALARELRRRLLEHGWPGNIRQLRNVLR